MSLNKALKELEIKQKNELLIKQQQQKNKQTASSILDLKTPKKDEKLVTIDNEDTTINTFDANLIELDASENPININSEMQNIENDLDNELQSIIDEINRVSNIADLNIRLTEMENLKNLGNLLPISLTNQYNGIIEYNTMENEINIEIDRRLNDAINRRGLTSSKTIDITKKNIIKQVNEEFRNIIRDTNIEAIKNYRNAYLKKEEEDFKNENKDRLKKYVQRVEKQNLYSNVVNVNRFENESDEEYRERLINIKNNPAFVNASKNQLLTREKNKLRQELLKLTNEINANMIINSEEIDENNIVDINKNFGKFETEIRRNYKNLKFDEFKNYFLDFVSKIDDSEIKFEPIEASISRDISALKSKLIETDKTYDNDTNPWEIDDIEDDAENYKISLANDRKKTKKFKASTLDNISKNKDILDIIDNLPDTELKSDLINKLNNQNYLNFQINKFQKELNPVIQQYRNQLMNQGSTKLQSKQQSERIFGYGINRSNNPNYVPFGKLKLNIKLLNDENKLRVLYKSHINVKEIKLTPISQNFVDLLNGILENDKFSISIFNVLDKSEQDLMLLLLQRAGLNKYVKDVKSKRDKEVEKISSKKEYNPSNKISKQTLDRWELLKGQILSGNDNRELIKEAINIVNLFKSTNHVSEEQANEQIEYLKSML